MPEQWELDVDAAMRELLGQVPPMTEPAHTRGRTLLLEAIDADAPNGPTTAHVTSNVHALPQRRRHTRRWIAAAAAVVALSVGAVVVSQTVGGNGGTPSRTPVTAAGRLLERAAVNVTDDQPVRPGQYRYIRVHGWGMEVGENPNKAPGTTFAVRSERMETSWIPADEADDWHKRWQFTGKNQWIIGSEEAAKAAEFAPPAKGTQKLTEPCGGEPPVNGRCAGSWAEPSPSWAASLPSDPKDMLALLRAEAKEHGDPFHGGRDGQALMMAAQGLERGFFPAKIRSALYRALAMMPDIAITEGQATLDGREGTAFAVPGGTDRIEIIVDPETGEFIGRRDVLVKPKWGIKPGTVMSTSAVTTAVVDKIGQRPPQ